MVRRRFQKNVIVAGQPVTTRESRAASRQSDCEKCYSHLEIYTKTESKSMCSGLLRS